MEVELGEIVNAQRTLLNPTISQEIRQQYYDHIATARTDYQAAMAIYEPLPQTPEEAREWQAFLAVLAEWREANDEFLRLSREFDALGILNPDELLATLQQFRSDVYALEVRVLEMIVHGARFEDGDEAATFERWRTQFAAANPRLREVLDALGQPHQRLYATARAIRDAVTAGDRAEATRLFVEIMDPASNEFLQYFYRLIEDIARVEELQEQLSALAMGRIRDL